MKRLIFKSVLFSLLFCVCSINAISQLTAEEASQIEAEVKEQFDKNLSATGQLNYEVWLEGYSKDNFISVVDSYMVGPFTYDNWIITVRESFSSRERQQITTLDETITPLTPGLAIITHSGIYENWWKTGEFRKDTCNTTLLWKKERDGWKIIHLNAEWIAIDE